MTSFERELDSILSTLEEQWGVRPSRPLPPSPEQDFMKTRQPPGQNEAQKPPSEAYGVFGGKMKGSTKHSLQHPLTVSPDFCDNFAVSPVSRDVPSVSDSMHQKAAGEAPAVASGASKVTSEMKAAAREAKSWPFEEARKILNRFREQRPEKGYVLFETGYGPSGLPHIGTFGEVVRTIMVQKAFETLSDIPTRLFAFSDDMDGLRKVPENVPHQDWLEEHLGQPLTLVPDPFETYESFGHHNNAMLREFLDSFGFQYEFHSATQHYKAGDFDTLLLKVLQHYEEIMALMLPTLRDERRATYSPFLPICPRTKRVLQVPLEQTNVEAGTVVYRDPDTQAFVEVPVTGGHCKLQWKVDWGSRWTAFGVDYEMSGKDLIPSVVLSRQICQILGGTPPESLSYELFLDQQGQKISKSKGNGLTIQEWLTYAPQESLAYYMFPSPKKAKRLYFDVIPRAIDDYIQLMEAYPNQSLAQQLDNPVFHIHQGHPPQLGETLPFNILLNLVTVCGSEQPEILWGFVKKYKPQASPETAPFLDRLIHYAVAYYRDFVKPTLRFRAPTDLERTALEDLRDQLAKVAEGATAEDLQTLVFEVGKKYPFETLRYWFLALYEVLLGQSEGPRMGSFIALYGPDNMRKRIDEKLR